MGTDSKIEWCDHTFNPWIGCAKVSEGCQHCYAEAYAKRYGKAEWGPGAMRVRTSAANWQKPLAWNRQALAGGRRYRVFCASLADVFEDHHDVNGWRVSLLELIEATRALDWLLLTKRPERVQPLIEQAAGRSAGSFFDLNPHVWIGASVENQEQAEKRIPHLVEVPAPVRFLSMEPLLGPVDLAPWLGGLAWVIVGGESGPHARPMHPDWVRALRDQCAAAGVSFFFKQWGEWSPTNEVWNYPTGVGAQAFAPRGSKPQSMVRLGKTKSGRTLDGRTWDEFPGRGEG